MPVFISHRTIDDYLAQVIHDHLTKTHGIECFLDQNAGIIQPEHVTRVITRALDLCSHLMVVITAETRDSWWVPFEIGYATSRNRAIASYTNYAQEKLPEYLWGWPILENLSELNQFARLYKQNRAGARELIQEDQRVVKSAKVRNFSIGTEPLNPKSFEQSLKTAIGQKY